MAPSLSCSVNTKITHLEERLESSRSPSVFQPLTIIQVDILHHAEHFLNAKYCSYYVTLMNHAQVPWHLNSRVSEKVVEGDVVRDWTRVLEMSQRFKLEILQNLHPKRDTQSCQV